MRLFNPNALQVLVLTTVDHGKFHIFSFQFVLCWDVDLVGGCCNLRLLWRSVLCESIRVLTWMECACSTYAYAYALSELATIVDVEFVRKGLCWGVWGLIHVLFNHFGWVIYCFSANATHQALSVLHLTASKRLVKIFRVTRCWRFSRVTEHGRWSNQSVHWLSVVYLIVVGIVVAILEVWPRVINCCPSKRILLQFVQLFSDWSGAVANLLRDLHCLGNLRVIVAQILGALFWQRSSWEKHLPLLLASTTPPQVLHWSLFLAGLLISISLIKTSISSVHF